MKGEKSKYYIYRIGRSKSHTMPCKERCMASKVEGEFQSEEGVSLPSKKKKRN